MPELPDVTVYVEALARRVVGEVLEEARLVSPFVLRTVDPPCRALVGRRVLDVGRLSKRILLEFEDDLFLAVHLMKAGRLRWDPPERTRSFGRKMLLARFRFPTGTLLMTEAGTKKRAAIHVVRGRAAVAALDRGGIEVFEASAEEFAAALRRENHTLKRALTDQRLVAGIGAAYADEILHAARLSPLTWTSRLDDEAIWRLRDATLDTLDRFTRTLRAEIGEGFPEKVTAFRDDMAVHGKFRQPCLVCGAPVQRIVYAETETNYCAACQTGGRVLADRALSRLLGKDWPRSLDALEDG